MIPDLLWRCPVCAVNDALFHTSRWLLPERLDCRNCGAGWQVRRVPGDHFYLKLLKKPSSASYPENIELSLASWYDEMKKTLRLEPFLDPQAPLVQVGETLYLASQAVELWAQADLAPGEVEATGSRIGCGRLFLTSARLVWKAGGHDCEFPWQQMNGAYTILNRGMALICAGQLFFFNFLQESPLKWVTYLALLAPLVQPDARRRLVTSHV